MAKKRRAASVAVERAQVDPLPRYVTWIMVDQETAVPRQFAVTFQLAEPLFLVSMDIEMEAVHPTVRKMEITRGRMNERGFVEDAEGGITASNLRQVLVDRLVRAAMELVRQPVERLPEDARAALIRGGAMPTDADRIARNAFRIPGVTPPGQFQVSPPAGPEREVTKDRIAKAAELYRRAVANGSKAPVKDVGIALGYSTSQASRFVKTARERGMLDEAPEPALRGVHAMPPDVREQFEAALAEGQPSAEKDPSMVEDDRA
jgi:hypothetical protein